MAAGGKASDTDLVRIDIPLGGASAEDTHGSLGILQRCIVLLAILTSRYAILQHNARDANRIEPIGNFRSLEIPRQDVVSSTGANEYGRSGI